MLFHCSEASTEDYRHIYCPHGTESWCKWQKNQALGNNEVIKTSISIQAVIREEIKPIFEQLSKDELLDKRTHGLTRNANEAINNIIWKRCPKSIFISRNTLEIGVAYSIFIF